MNSSARRAAHRGTSNDMSGSVVGPVVQAGTIHRLTLHSAGGGSGGGGSGDEPDPDSDDKKPAAGFVGFVLVAGLLLYLSQGDGGNIGRTPFPVEQGARPVASSTKAVLDVVGKKLLSCAAEVVLQPANCPQGLDSPLPAHGVRWTLVGDPIDGAEVVWNNGKFHARGNAVMLVDYETANGPKHDTQAFHFQTELPWQGESTTIDNVYRVEDALAGKIVKRRPGSTAQEVSAVVRDEFVRCAGATSAPMPVGCPTTNAVPVVKNVTWAYEGDPPPNANARQDFDPEFGIIHVVGSYSATVRRQSGQDAARPYFTLSGDYAATVIEQDGRIRPLRIIHK
ncbi:hypothetical protein ACFFQW_22950 [Umezawaea endophytica]|uniref:Uncharacterized protein n=1 Tax=Umezawaea endophytica TaxID=1654476 RepID=A0A9X2VSB4_9PSEU|nr:hypothetical protein [Umezawaea endophytica]MCS7481437.1 hypothetical protein [Umezawaea endophytica]